MVYRFLLSKNYRFLVNLKNCTHETVVSSEIINVNKMANEITGKVTKVDDVFCFFELNNQVRVHMSIWILRQKSNGLPELGSNISIKQGHLFSTTIVACPSSIMKGAFKVNFQSSSFISLVESFSLGAPDLIMIDKWLQILDKYFKDVEGNKRQSIISFLLHQKDLQQNNLNILHSCMNKCLSNTDIISVSSCRYIKIQPKSYPEFPYWSFGVHNKPTTKMLFGILQVKDCYGFFMLEDSLYQIACVIYNCTAEDLLKLVNQYVLIKDFKIVTEIYNAEGVPNVECLIVNFTDIIKMESDQQNTIQHIIGVEPDPKIYEFSIEFQIKKKSSVLIGFSSQPEYYLDILLRGQDGVKITERVFLIFPKEYIPSLSFLEIDGVYKLYHREKLQTIKHYELNRIANQKIYQIAEKEAKFKVVHYSKEPVNIMTVEESKKSLLRSNLLSFKGVLKQKRLANSLSSRTVKRSKLYGFGTPGSKVHQLVFSYTNASGNDEYLDVYLNNWENTLMPLALIPDMEVVVKNVAPQSGKYFKATVLTTIDIVAYRPEVNYQTVNLYDNMDIDWGPRFFLGRGNSIPFSVLVWGKCSVLQILSVKITSACVNCNLAVAGTECCRRCGKKETKLDFLSKLHVSDIYGQSKVLLKDMRLLRVMLNMTEYQWEKITEHFNEIGEFNFSLFETYDAPSASCCTRVAVTENLIYYFMNVNKKAFGDFHLKCRKLHSSPERNGGRPLWFLLDVRTG